MSASSQPPPTGGQRRLAGLVAGVLVLGGLTAVLLRLPAPVRVQSDFVAPSLMVGDCLELGRCDYQINPFGDATILGIQHGSLFDDALLLATFLGEPLSTYRLFTELSAFAALLLFFLWARRSLSEDTALLVLGASLLVWRLLCPEDPSSIWNPALLPLPAFAFAAAAASYFLSRRLTYLAIASLSAAVAAQAHVAAFALGLPLVYLLAGTEPARRGRHALVAGLFAWGALQVGSPAMFTDLYLPRPPLALLLPLLGGGLVALALLLRLARRYPRGEGGLLLFLALTHLPLFVAIRLLRPEETRYAFSLVPGVALALALLPGWLLGAAGRSFPLAARWPARLLAAGALVALLAAGLPESGSRPDPARPAEAPETVLPELEGVRSVALFLREHTLLEFPQAFRRLRGGIRLKPVLNGLALFLPREGEAPAPARAAPDLTVFPLSNHSLPDPLPRDWYRVDPPVGPPWLLRLRAPTLDWDRFALLVADPADTRPPRWRSVDYAFAPAIHPADRKLLAARSDAGLSPFLYGLRADPILLRIPFRRPAGSPPLLLALPPPPRDPEGPSGCEGTILGVEGLGPQQPLPARHLLLPQSEEEQRGTLLLAYALGGAPCTWGSAGLPPPVLELEAADAGLLSTVFPGSELAGLEGLLSGRAAPRGAGERSLVREADALNARALDRELPLAELQPWPRDFVRHKEPQSGLAVKLASVLALWLTFLAALLRLLWPGRS
ncbi:MAG: hypothetical protein P1V51_17090 [Deltaproteobacteria bacterium]|nr:hypothetical protein [Deltaproteobacteria bacterium]